MLSVMADLGNLRALNDAGQVEETFLGHENLLISFDFGERFWKEIQIIGCYLLCCYYLWQWAWSSSGREGWCWLDTRTALSPPAPLRILTTPTPRCLVSHERKFENPKIRSVGGMISSSPLQHTLVYTSLLRLKMFTSECLIHDTWQYFLVRTLMDHSSINR